MTGLNITPLKRVLQWLLGGGHQVWLVADSNPFPFKQPENYSFLESFISRPVKELRSGNNTQTSQKNHEQEVEQILSLQDSIKPHIVHAFGLGENTSCCVQAGIHPIVVSAWGYLNYLFATPVEANKLLPPHQEILQDIDAIIVEAPLHIPILDRLTGGRLRIVQIVLGVDPTNFRPGYEEKKAGWKKTLNIPSEAVLLFSPRGWGRIYQHDLILEAFSIACSQLPGTTFLGFSKLGRGVESLDQIELVKEKARYYGIFERTCWFPGIPYEMMPILYAISHQVISYPSTDAFPMTLLESMACERTVITANLPAYRYTLIEDYCILVEPNQPSALADAIIWANNHPLSLEHLDRGRNAVISLYNETKAIDSLFELYRSLV